MQGADAITIVYSIAILIMSVVIHEVSHGYAALYLGDPTAKYEKRLTLNPLNHLDPLGSIMIPLVTYMTGGFIFGWAKPVPYNPYNLRNPKRDEALVALAGPLSNFCIALVAALTVDFFAASLPTSALSILLSIVFVNVGLMIFNLIPIYPLDGSKIFLSFLPVRYENIKVQLARYSLPIFLVFILFFSQYLTVVMQAVVYLLIPGLRG